MFGMTAAAGEKLRSIHAQEFSLRISFFNEMPCLYDLI